MLSQTSFISASSSAHKSYINSSKLLQIETHVFNRIVDLKNEKIQLLAHFSQMIDHKYQVENQLRNLLQIKKSKEQNLAPREQSKKAIHRNVELKSELEDLIKITTRSKKNDLIDQMARSKLSSQSRSKSLLPQAKSKSMKKAEYSRSNNQLLGNSKIEENKLKSSKKSNIAYDDEDELVEKILSQRELTDSLARLIEEQKNTGEEQYQHEYLQQEAQNIKKRVQNIRKLLSQREQQMMVDKLSRTKQRVSQKQKQQNSKVMGENGSNAVRYSIQEYETDAQVQIKELLKYIEQENEEKRLLYQELSEFVQEMSELRIENQQMKNQFSNTV